MPKNVMPRPAPKHSPPKTPGGEETVRAQRERRHAVGDGEDVVRLEGALAREVVRLVQQPDGPVPLLARLQGHRPEALVPQVLVRVARVVLHAHRRARHQRKLREELRPGEAAGFGNLPQQTQVRRGDGDGGDAARAHPGAPLVALAVLLALGARQALLTAGDTRDGFVSRQRRELARRVFPGLVEHLAIGILFSRAEEEGARTASEGDQGRREHEIGQHEPRRKREDPIDERLSFGIERALARAPPRGRLDIIFDDASEKRARRVTRSRTMDRLVRIEREGWRARARGCRAAPTRARARRKEKTCRHVPPPRIFRWSCRACRRARRRARVAGARRLDPVSDGRDGSGPIGALETRGGGFRGHHDASGGGERAGTRASITERPRRGRRGERGRVRREHHRCGVSATSCVVKRG